MLIEKDISQIFGIFESARISPLMNQLIFITLK